ncbi:MAG: sigma-70 family RNA polymerase sigma factor [Planctomycetaceae bacterium]
MNNKISEESLVDYGGSLSIEAFEQLVRANQRLVRSFLIQHIGDQQVADDLAQEVFVAAYRGLDKYRGAGTFSSWLLGIARNHVLMHFRSKPPSMVVSLDSILEGLHLKSLEQNEFDTSIEQQRVDALRSCIQSLEPVQRDLLARFYYRSEAAEEIGQSIGKRAGAVRMLLMRIRKQLRTCIESKLRVGESA